MKPVLTFLTDDEVKKVHETALDILETTGFQMPSEKAMDYMESFGATVDRDTHVVKIPPALVQDSIDKATKKKDFILYGRTREFDMDIGNEGPFFGTMANATFVLDAIKRERHPATTEDLIKATRLLEALPNFDCMGAILNQQDVPHEVVDWHTWADQIMNTRKHIIGTATGAQIVRDVKDMCSAVLGSEEAFLERPYVSFWILTRPALAISRLTLEAMMECALWGIPVSVDSGPISGGTGPVTLIGNVTQAHAETLACLTLSQQISPGTPFMYAPFCRTMDMRSGNVSMDSPEWAIMKGCSAQLGKYCELPIRLPSMLRDAKLPDAQAGYESGITGLVAALAGADIIDGAEMDMDMIIDLGDITMNNEIIGAIKRICRGTEVNENTLALDVIKEVGHGGNFLAHSHTMKNFRDTNWKYELTERRNWTKWVKDGKKDFYEKALEKTEKILAEPFEPLVTPEAEKTIREIVKNASIDYSKSI